MPEGLNIKIIYLQTEICLKTNKEGRHYPQTSALSWPHKHQSCQRVSNALSCFITKPWICLFSPLTPTARFNSQICLFGKVLFTKKKLTNLWLLSINPTYSSYNFTDSNNIYYSQGGVSREVWAELWVGTGSIT